MCTYMHSYVNVCLCVYRYVYTLYMCVCVCICSHFLKNIMDFTIALYLESSSLLTLDETELPKPHITVKEDKMVLMSGTGLPYLVMMTFLTLRLNFFHHVDASLLLLPLLQTELHGKVTCWSSNYRGCTLRSGTKTRPAFMSCLTLQTSCSPE